MPVAHSCSDGWGRGEGEASCSIMPVAQREGGQGAGGASGSWQLEPTRVIRASNNPSVQVQYHLQRRT